MFVIIKSIEVRFFLFILYFLLVYLLFLFMLDFQYNINLAQYTTFWVQAKAKLFIEISSEDDFLELLETKEREQNPHIFLGNWANTLFVRDFDWLVVKVAIKGKHVLEENALYNLLEIGSGEDWNDFVWRTIERWRAWLENMVAIPSSVWAAAFWNIWAYWMEAKDRIIWVCGIDIETKQTLVFSNNQCEFWYRNSIFKHHYKDKFFITKVLFALDIYTDKYIINSNYKDIKESISLSWQKITLSDLAKTITTIRSTKLPDRKILWTAGSFFKNPVISKENFSLLQTNFVHLISYTIPEDPTYLKLSAGQLIELAWFKWYRLWNVWIYDKHALILINYGGATWKEIVNLAEIIHNKVQEMFWVSLDPEVMYVY